MWTNQGKGELSPRPCYRTEARKVPFYYLKSLQGFQSKLASRTQLTLILHVNFLLKSILKPNCQRSGYVFGMKKEKQSGYAPDDVSEWEGQ